MSEKVTQQAMKFGQPDHQLNMHETLQAELREAIDKYTAQGLMPVLIADAFAAVDAEAHLALIHSGFKG